MNKQERKLTSEALETARCIDVNLDNLIPNTEIRTHPFYLLLKMQIASCVTKLEELSKSKRVKEENA